MQEVTYTENWRVQKGKQNQPGHQENQPVSGAKQQEQLCVSC